MTIKKAIDILDWIITNKTKTNKELYAPGFVNSEFDMCKDLYRVLLGNSETDISNLKTVREQLIPKCKHPKKMQDICKGQKYCMACNMDL